MILQTKWSKIGVFHTSNVPNGYLLIRCKTHVAMQKLRFDGPWVVNGVTLQLAPLQPYFEPTFYKLSATVIWLQLHNLPVEFWDRDSLETVASHIGRLPKIDNFTSSLLF